MQPIKRPSRKGNEMKKITTLFALALSLMLTVAFTPSFAFAADNGSAQNSGNKYKAVDEITGATDEDETVTDEDEDTEDDIDFGDPLNVKFTGKYYQKAAYEMLAIFNAGYGTTNNCKVTWNTALEKFAMQRAADQAIYHSEEYAPDGTDDTEGYGSDDDGVLTYVTEASTAEAAYKAFYDEILTGDDTDYTDDTDVDDTDDTNDTDVDDTDDTDTDTDDESSPEFASMAAAKFVAGGKTYWYIALSDTAAKNKTAVNKIFNKTVTVSAGSNILNLDLTLTASDNKLKKGRSCKYSISNKSADSCTVTITSPRVKCGNTKLVKITSKYIKGLKKGSGTLKLGTIKIGTITVY